ncbi:MAG: tetratricopeptide repeat protein [Pyrinomonadaceae bacterium]
MPLKTIKIETTFHRLFLITGAIVCIIAVIIFVKWSFGHTISVRAEQKEVAAMSVGLAPDDPQTHFSSAVLHEKNFLPEDLERSLAEYEKSAALSPNDYLLWLALGKSRERNGDVAGAEKALRRAVELAPNYVDSHWTLGNNLLRQGKSEEAYSEIRQSTIGSDKYVISAIATAWQIFNGDISLIRKNIGDSPKLNSFLAVFLLRQKHYDEAFEVWNAISQDMKTQKHREQSEDIYNQLVGAGKFRYARTVKASLVSQENTDIFGKITNGGFENNVRQQKSDFFDWQIAEAAQPLIGFDDRIKHDGNLSLVIIFNSPNGQDFRAVSQTVAVKAGKSYQFQAFYKSESKALGTLRWEILNAADRSVLAATEAIAENSDWSKLAAAFSVPENTEAVIVNLVRVNCGSTFCPISGKIWFDDFSLSEK